MPRIVKELDIEIHAAPDSWAGNPNVILLRSGEILIGFRRSGFPLRGDSDPTLRPFAMKCPSIEDIPAAKPVMILDEANSLTPDFFQRKDGLILSYFNRYGTYRPADRAQLEAAGKTPFFERDGLLFTREPITVMSSSDGVRWEPFSQVDIPGFAYPPAFRGSMLYADDGAILFAVYSVREPGHTEDMLSLLVRSRDGGKSWEFVSVIAEHPGPNVGFNETFLYRTESGRLVAFLRSGPADHNIHTAVSEDGGQTWAPFTRHEVYGFPQHALRLRSGNVLLTYGVRRGAMGVRGKLLDPECRNVDEAEEFVVRDDSATGSCGYPSAVQLPDGRIFIVYYITREEGSPAMIAGSVLREKE